MAGAARRSIREGLLAGPLDRLDEVSLCGSRCAACGETSLGASALCPNCGADAASPMPLGREGTVWTYTIVRHKPPGNYQGPDPFRPFGLGLVELPQGIRVLVPIDAPPEALKIGMPVRFHPYVLRTDDSGAEVVAFNFRPS